MNPRPQMPELVRPMLATAGDLPTRDESDWGFEMKWDGVRAIVYVDRGTVRVLTRNDRDVSASYPEVGGLGAVLGDRRMIFDGELVACDADGRPSFGELQQRMHVQRPSAALRERVPVSLLLFDLLYVDTDALLTTPYAERRERLEQLELDGPCWATPPAFDGDGDAALELSRAQRLEGVIAKRRTSVYEPGRRSRSWVKVKHQRTQDVVIVGWKSGEGTRRGGIGSLLLGVTDGDGRLVYAGHVGTGFTARMLDDLAARLRPLQQREPPLDDEVPRAHARGATWVAPQLVGEVVFTEWTRDGRLRHPSWRGLRPDKTPSEAMRDGDLPWRSR